MSDENGADVALELGGQKVNLRNVKSLNTLLTLLGCVGVLFVGYLLWEHKIDDKEFKGHVLTAIKEQSQSNRVLACLMATRQEEREAKLAQCERIAR
jgi:hypothetical protein